MRLSPSRARTLRYVRAAPTLQRAAGPTLLVDGTTAVGIGSADVLFGALPLFVAIVVVSDRRLLGVGRRRPRLEHACHRAAAAIIIGVSLSFVFGSERPFKPLGPGAASAVFLDAFVIGRLLLPAVLELGRRTWQLPRRLSPRLPTVPRHPPSEATPALETSQ